MPWSSPALTERRWTAEAGASLRELMERMGHSSTRAALIYQHSSTEQQRALADTLGALVIAKLGSGHDTSRHLARKWHAVREMRARRWG